MTTYYVSDADGKDSNSGTSEGNAWKTIQKATDTMNKKGMGPGCLLSILLAAAAIALGAAVVTYLLPSLSGGHP